MPILFESRIAFLRLCNDILYRVDKLFDFQLPHITFHKDTYCFDYYQDGFGDYFHPHGLVNQFENAMC